MTRETMIAILEGEGLKASAKGHPIPEERDLTVFISTAGDAIQIGRVTRIEPRELVAVLETAKSERFFFAYQDILGMRMGEGPAKDRATGFGR